MARVRSAKMAIAPAPKDQVQAGGRIEKNWHGLYTS